MLVPKMPDCRSPETTKTSREAVFKFLSRSIGFLPLAVLVAGALLFGRSLPAWGYMWAMAIALFGGVKWLSWWEVRNAVAHRPARSLAYLTLWPGMNARSFLCGLRPRKPALRNWFWALSKTCLGVVLLWSVARYVPSARPLLRGWVGLFGLVLVLHFGTFEIVALGWQALGVDAEPIMQSPIFSDSLSEFWGKRWNLGFHQLAHELVFRPVRPLLGVRLATLLVFLFSGLIHELVISLPARGGYGLPTSYFLLQSAGVLFERSGIGRWLHLRRGVPGWAFTAIMTAAPAFWLFHPLFVLRVVLPFMKAIRAL